MRSVIVIILILLAAAAQADIACKTYFDYQNVDLAARQRLRFMAGPDLGPVSTDLQYDLSAASTGTVAGGWDRFNLKWADWTVGRDAVSFGVGRIWSPNDLFAPFAPTEIDKDYKTGIDLVRYDRSLSDTSDVTLVYAPVKDTPGSFVCRLRLPLGNYGTSLIAGQLQDDATVGLTFDGPVGGAGFRGSVNCLTSREGQSVYKFILGSDYLFSNGLYVVGEYYYNGPGAQSRSGYDWPSLLSGNIYNVAQHYLALGSSLDFWSLWTATVYVIGNLDDGSNLYWEEIDYSLSDESTLHCGVILSSGKTNSEYSALTALAYTLLSVYF